MAELLDIIMVACIIILGIRDIKYLILQAEKIVKKEKLKNGETFEDATKRVRKSGIVFIVAAIIFFITQFLI